MYSFFMFVDWALVMGSYCNSGGGVIFGPSLARWYVMGPESGCPREFAWSLDLRPLFRTSLSPFHGICRKKLTWEPELSSLKGPCLGFMFIFQSVRDTGDDRHPASSNVYYTTIIPRALGFWYLRPCRISLINSKLGCC